MRVVDKNTGETYFTHDVEEGDIWRMAQTKDEPIRDWVKLAVSRAKVSINYWRSDEPVVSQLIPCYSSFRSS